MKLPPFYPILDTETLSRRACAALTAAEAILEGGAAILQLRHKGHFTRQLYDETREIAALCRSVGAIFIVDDRADIAALIDAGVHLGQDDLPPSDARAIVGPGRILGYSTHNEEQLCAARTEPADYLAIGPIFQTGSKCNPDPVVGVESLSRLRARCERPLVAIGGITRENARAVLDAGADSVAVIADLYPATTTKESLRQRTEEWLALLK